MRLVNKRQVNSWSITSQEVLTMTIVLLFSLHTLPSFEGLT
jgi:hypothetical protein